MLARPPAPTSRASIWESGFKEEFAAEVDGLTMGDVTDLSNFIGAVIDERAFAKNKAAIDRAKADPAVEVVAGGTYDDSVGYFVRPTVARCAPTRTNEVFTHGVLRPDPRRARLRGRRATTRC